MILKVKYHKKTARPITQAHNGEWFDLRTAEDVRLKKGDFKLIHLGVSIEMPEGYEAIIAPRSSTFGKYGILLANSIGVIDNAYCGNNDEWKFLAYCLGDYTYIPAGTRIAQFRIQRIMEPVEIVEVDNLDGEDRGGIGSTGER